MMKVNQLLILNLTVEGMMYFLSQCQVTDVMFIIYWITPFLPKALLYNDDKQEDDIPLHAQAANRFRGKASTNLSNLGLHM